jgi:hypothetical protein
MVEVIYRRRKYMVAERWDELTPKQFLNIVKVLTGDIERTKAKLMILRLLLGMKWWCFLLIRPRYLPRLLELTDWVEDSSALTAQLVPVVYVGEKLYGAKGDFDNIRAAEFHFADMYYTEWKINGDDGDLYRFLAVLYRPGKKGYNKRKDPDGDIRLPFNPNTTEYYAAKMRRLTAEEIKGIVLCYESWRRNMEARHPRIFTLGNKARAVRNGWFPVFRGIASANKYGPIESVEQMFMHTLLLELEMLKDEEAELRRTHPELFKNK